MCFDGEKPEACHIETRKARKAHKCCECARVIEPGETYQHVWGVWDREMFVYETCMKCKAARDTFVDNAVADGCDRESATPAFSYLHEAMREYDIERGHKPTTLP